MRKHWVILVKLRSANAVSPKAKVFHYANPLYLNTNFFVSNEAKAIEVKVINVSSQFQNGPMVKKKTIEDLKQILTSKRELLLVMRLICTNYHQQYFPGIWATLAFKNENTAL